MKIILGITLMAVGGAFLVACSMPKQEGGPLTIEQVKERHEDELMAIEGVVGVGIGECEGQPCIKVLLANDSPELEQKIPDQLDGFKVETEVTGPIEALPE